MNNGFFGSSFFSYMSVLKRPNHRRESTDCLDVPSNAHFNDKNIVNLPAVDQKITGRAVTQLLRSWRVDKCAQMLQNQLESTGQSEKSHSVTGRTLNPSITNRHHYEYGATNTALRPTLNVPNGLTSSYIDSSLHNEYRSHCSDIVYGADKNASLAS